MRKNLKEILSIEKQEPSVGILLILIMFSYFFSIAVRYIWVIWASKHPEFYWNGQLMINTNDGYLWAEGARDILRNHINYIESRVTSPVSVLTAWLVKMLPFSFETVILWIPAFLGSLLVIPVILIGRVLKITYVGFVASLLAGIAWSYYNRTMTGYYDTDMLVIVLPTFVLWGLILAIKEKRNRYLLITAFSVMLYQWWYAGSYSLNFAMALMVFIYSIVFDKKDVFNYKLLIFLFISVAGIAIWFKIVLSIGLFAYFHIYKEKSDKYVLYILIVSMILVLITGGFNPILAQLKSYVFRSAVAADNSLSLHYFSVVQTVREAGAIPFELFAKRISGHPVTFIISTIGYILMTVRYPVMLLALPMLGLGFLAYGIPGIIPPGGLRFTVYAVPVNALGLAYVIFLTADYIKRFFDEKISDKVKIGFITFFTILVLYPNIKHVYAYKTPVVFDKEEVKILNDLKHIAKRKDYVLTWWDYGYPIRYYSDVWTLVDGGKHSGDVNFPASFILSKDQISSANMARLSVEYTIMQIEGKKSGDLIASMMKDYGYNNSNQFLKALNDKNFKLPPKTRDIYIYLPFKMISIFSTVTLFSNLDLMSGKQYPTPFFYKSVAFHDNGRIVDLGQGVRFSKVEGVLLIGNNKIPIHSFIVTEYDKDLRLQIKDQTVYENANMYVIYMKSYKLFLVMDKNMFNSLYIQMFVLDRYDPDLYEPAIISPWVKIFKLKR